MNYGPDLRAGQGAIEHEAGAVGRDGYRLEADGDRWASLHHRPCGKLARFVNPTDERVRWYKQVHRCGLPGTDWHVGGKTAITIQDAGLLTATMRSTAHAVEGAPVDVFRDGDVYATAQLLASALENALMTVGRTDHITRTGP